MATEAPRIVETKFTVYSKKGRALKERALLSYNKGRIEFLASPFSLKDEIKAMAGAKWHGYDTDDGRKIWSVDDCRRNNFQLRYLQGEDVYAWFDQEVVQHEYPDRGQPMYEHQREMADAALTFHFQLWAVEMGLGKTRAAIEVIEKAQKEHWFWIGPKKPIAAVKREFRKWGLDRDINLETFTYDAFVRYIDDWKPGDPIPNGLIGDEWTRIKQHDSQRSQAMQFMADRMREKYAHDAYIILMSGTPSPKSPVDWWSPCEIADPGFLKEGSERAFKLRLAFVAQRDFGTGGVHNDLLGWKDDGDKCNKCGCYKHEHDMGMDDHAWEPSVNEVAYLHERLKPLVIVKFKKDCVDLPEKQYRVIRCKPTSSTLRVAQALSSSSINAVTGLTLLRELSDGFQYRDVPDGMEHCTVCDRGEGPTGEIKEWYDPLDEERGYSSIDMLNPEFANRLETRMVTCLKCDGTKEVEKTKRISREVPCPKEDALVELLAECEEHGRIVVFAGFEGSVNRCVDICLREDWHVVRCDGRGFSVFYRDSDGTVKTVTKIDPLDYWADLKNNHRVAFVAHPESGGLGLTLTEASMVVFWSNSFKPEYRTQSEDRIHRLGMDENRGAIIVDLVHLPTDERVLEVIRQNRKLELMTMGDFKIDSEAEQELAA